MAGITAKCPGCGRMLTFEPTVGWVSNDMLSTEPCTPDERTHSDHLADLLGEQFHLGGKRALRDAGMADAVQLPDWSETTDLQKVMVVTGLGRVLAYLSRTS